MIVATLDTDVLLSGILFVGVPRQVMRRPKFGLEDGFVHTVVRELEAAATMIS